MMIPPIVVIIACIWVFIGTLNAVYNIIDETRYIATPLWVIVLMLFTFIVLGPCPLLFKEVGGKKT